MDAIVAVKRGVARRRAAGAARSAGCAPTGAARRRPTPEDMPARSDVAADNPVPAPPFWGDRIVKGIALADYAAFLDERATFMGQWGLKPAAAATARRTRSSSRPRAARGCGLAGPMQTEGMLEAAVVYGYFPASARATTCRASHDRSRRTAER